MVEIDNGPQMDFESKLAEALVELRNQHEEQVRIYKDEIGKTYNSKVTQQRVARELTNECDFLLLFIPLRHQPVRPVYIFAD